ncbi:cytochrome P450 4F22-like isoform X1 [Pomacea canaliculata]|uniref:cytochrome P450 4F22-like isoform X1 n=2 Tax=Pomacea canaliculata TaxID=400727 RepID=UPI000D739478|nr:cytochrome P450 4F22-like isoform X1 [Pomacea canaliculata]
MLAWAVVTATVLLLGKLVTVFRSFRVYASIFNKCPGETDFHWLYGTLHKFPGPNERGIQYDTDCMEKRPRFSRVWAGPFTPVLFIYHPELIRLILKTSAPKPRGKLLVSDYDMGLGWLGEGLLISNGARWARSRRLLTPAFHFEILRSYVVIENRACDLLLSKIQKQADIGKPFEAFDYVSLCLFDILLQCAFSYSSNCQITGNEDPYVSAVNELLKLWNDRIRQPLHLLEFIYRLSAKGRRWYQLCDYVHNVSEDLINKRHQLLKERADNQDSPTKKQTLSFVDILLTARDEDGKGLTLLEIRNEADTFLFEGFDTTTSALSWTLYSLARWPQHQAQVQEEVDALLQDRETDDILWDDLSQLPYTTACIYEAIRNYSTVPVIERMTDKPLDIDGHPIPAGTYVAFHLWMLHHNPTVWDRPHEYLPERFLGDRSITMDPFQFVPFSAGPRNCIGQNFAMKELKILVARIFHRFHLKLDPDHEVMRMPLATFKTENGIKLIAKMRKSTGGNM